MFEFGEYGFIKWKFKFWNFLSENLKISIFNRSKFWLDRLKMVKKKILEFLDVLIPVRSIEKSTWLIKSNFRPIENRETGFSVEFSDDCSERLKRFQALLTVLWNILTLHMYILMKHNSMGINRGLYSLEKIVSLREIQEILWSFSRIPICRT